MKVNKILLGMALQAFIVATLLIMGALVVTPAQQAIAGVTMLILAFMIPDTSDTKRNRS